MSNRTPGKKFDQFHNGSSFRFVFQPISVAADFPTNAEADKNPDVIYIGATDPSVIDNDPSKTNTGYVLKVESEAIWNIITQQYVTMGPQAIWVKDDAGNRVYLVTPADIDLQTKGLKDVNVTTAVKIGDADNKSAGTINKTILGSINENSANVGTGLVYGGEISINADPTKIDIADGGVKVVDSYTDPKKPVLVLVEWTGLTGISVTNIGTQFVTFFGINAAGTVIQAPASFSPEDERDIATLGLASHVNLATVDTVNNFGNWLRDTKLDIADLLSGLGARINLAGNKYTANGSNLRLNKSAGAIFGMGVNYATDKKIPNIKPDVALPDISFVAIKRPTIPAFLQDVPNVQYDPNGDGTLIDIPEGYFTTHRIFYDTSSEKTFLQYGQFIYDSLKKAATSWEKEDYQVDPVLANVMLETIIVIRRDCPALNDVDCVKFIQMGIFGSRTFNVIENFSRFAESIETIDGMGYQRQALSYVDDGGVLYVDVAAEFVFTATDISFANADSSINTVAEDFTTANLQVGDKISVSGSASNNGIFTVVTVAATKIVVSETVADESASAPISIDTPGKGDITFVFGQREFILDCTTGSGVGGRARIALTAGTDIAPQENWVYVIRSGETAILQSATSEPADEYSMICTALVPSVAESISSFYNSRRHTDTKEIDGRGVIPTILSKLRDPTDYKSGAGATITIDTGPSPDSVDFTVDSGVFREIYLQTTLAMQLSIDSAIIVNDSITPYRQITDLNEITLDASGNTLNNKYFQLIVAVSLNADGHPDRLLINLPTNSYLSASAAFEDVSDFSVTNFPAGFNSVYLLFAAVLKIQGGTIITNEAIAFGVNNVDLRGHALGSKSSGSGTAAITTDSTLTGNGTVATPLGIALTNSNFWAAVQVFLQGLRTDAIAAESGNHTVYFEDAGVDVNVGIRDASGNTKVLLKSNGISEIKGGDVELGEDGVDGISNVRDAAGVAKVILNSNGDSEFNGGDVLFDGLRQIAIKESLADDASIDLPSGVTGWGFIMAGDNEEYAHFRFTSAGVVSLTYNSSNVVNTDTDTKFCIFDNGTNVRIRNRLGAAKAIKATIYLG